MYDNAVIPVNILLTKYFTKYYRLDQIIPGAFRNYNTDELNIYVDLYGLYKTLYSSTYRTDVSDYTAFTSTIINMCAHYRSYFATHFGVRTNIFIISSDNIPKECISIYPQYNQSHILKMRNSLSSVGEMIKLNNELLEILCPYLPNIYFFKTNFESTVLIEELYQRENRLKPNIAHMIISTDIYPMQLLPIHSNMTFLRPKKSNGSDNSIITELDPTTFDSTFWNIVYQQRGNASKFEKLMNITPSNFTLLEALNRFTERDFSVLLNISTCSRLLDRNTYRNSKLLPETLYSFAPKELANIPLELVSVRYNCIDFHYQYNIFKESVECSTLHYENLNDPSSIKTINDKFFTLNPIDILRL